MSKRRPPSPRDPRRASAPDRRPADPPPGEARSSLRIDTAEFARTAGEHHGRFTPADLERLASLLSDGAGELRWRARGARRRRPDGDHDDLLFLALDGELGMPCVRCLERVPVRIEAERAFRLVASEDQAEREDVDEVDHDVLAGGQRFDLGALIEDEAIMTLPPIVRHEDCPLPPGADGGEPPAEDEERPKPFAALAALRKTSH